MSIHDEFDEEEKKEGSGETGGETGESGGRGTGGQIRYRDPYSSALRDDLLPPNELKRLLIVHRDLHKERVNKQKMTRKERAAMKDGRLHYTARERALGIRGGGVSKFRQHPISLKAQFSGMDKQTSHLPNQFDAETNLDKRNELEHRFTLQNMPKFNPKPRPM